MSHVTITGNITRAAELRYTPGGKAVASFGIADNRRYQVNGEWQEDVSFYDVTAWDKLGENVAASLDKGDRVIIVGRLQQRQWEDADGGKRSKVEVVADEIGPSLRWATATVEKVSRTDGDTSRPSGGTSGGKAQAYDDQEPF